MRWAGLVLLVLLIGCTTKDEDIKIFNRNMENLDNRLDVIEDVIQKRIDKCEFNVIDYTGKIDDLNHHLAVHNDKLDQIIVELQKANQLKNNTK